MAPGASDLKLLPSRNISEIRLVERCNMPLFDVSIALGASSDACEHMKANQLPVRHGRHTALGLEHGDFRRREEACRQEVQGGAGHGCGQGGSQGHCPENTRALVVAEDRARGLSRPAVPLQQLCGEDSRSEEAPSTKQEGSERAQCHQTLSQMSKLVPVTLCVYIQI
jgi:hypothetical protein